MQNIVRQRQVSRHVNNLVFLRYYFIESILLQSLNHSGTCRQLILSSLTNTTSYTALAYKYSTQARIRTQVRIKQFSVDSFSLRALQLRHLSFGRACTTKTHPSSSYSG